ncbi:MAG TPA: hypothetical protein VK014_12600 [Cyclobacteriaceae bacterium]|nr:hypothetical protein [Cyclobacteriaceae bacterium]
MTDVGGRMADDRCRSVVLSAVVRGEVGSSKWEVGRTGDGRRKTGEGNQLFVDDSCRCQVSLTMVYGLSMDHTLVFSAKLFTFNNPKRYPI